MLSSLAVFSSSSWISVFIVAGLCCLPKEYPTREGQCCPMCHEGTVVRRDCTSQSGTRCTSCANGTFMNQPNGLTKCLSCASCEGHGLFARQSCTATADTVCDVLDGYFCSTLTDEKGCSLAQKHMICRPGHRTREPGTSRADTVCESCPHGYFSVHGWNCTVWTTCSETQVKKKEGSTISDVVCGAASREHYFYIAFILPVLTVAGLVIKGLRSVEKSESSGPPPESSGPSRIQPASHSELLSSRESPLSF